MCRRLKDISGNDIFGGFWTSLRDSRHSQVAIYTVFDEESEFQVKNKQILDPGGKI